MRLLARLLLGLSFPFAAHAAVDVPAPLEAWRGWVMHEQEYRACPLISGHAGAEAGDFMCAWPGVLTLAADDKGANIVQRWRVDAESWVRLPGDDEHWPQQVTVDGQPAAVVDNEGPAVRLAAGNHELRARIPWSERPQTLRIPESIGLVALSVDGKPVAPVQRDGDDLTLGRAAIAAPEADSLQLRVYRQLADDIPAILTTRMDIAVSGHAREEVVGPVLPKGFAPLALVSEWPARVDADGRLHVRVQPGSDTVTLIARANAPLTEVVAQVPPEPWPAQEIWSYATAPQLRVTVASGALSVDPVQAQVPAEWAQLPAFALADGGKLTIEERSRGEDPTAQNQLRLYREMWLDFDGGGWFARDNVSGRMLRDWRLDVAAPYALERADAGNEPLLVTRGAEAGLTGVEWHASNVNLNGGLRIASKAGDLPITGWRTTFDSATAVVHLPDGYRLLGAPGADYARGSWVSAWTLYDVFIAALLALLAWRLLGVAGVLLACAYLVLGYQEAGAPRWTLLAVLGIALALRNLPDGRVAHAFEWLRRAALALLVLVALPFVALQLRNALHPQLEREAGIVAAFGDTAFGEIALGRKQMQAPPMQADEMVAAEAPMPSAAPAAPPPPRPERDRADKSKLSRAAGGLVSSVDSIAKIERYSESTVMQTGAGEPSWQRGHRYELGWSGRVLPDQSVRLLIAPSWLVRILRVLLVGVLAWLVLRLLQPALRSLRMPRATNASLAGLLAIAAFAATPSAHAQAYPPNDLLQQLRTRIAEPPKCAPNCAAFARADIVAHGDEIRVMLEAHALERVALQLPSDRKNLDLRRVALDGAAQEGIAFGDDALWIAVPRGVHHIELVFVAVSDKLALDFPLQPRRIEFSGEGWEAGGIDDAHLLTQTLTLVRTRANGEAPVGSTQQFAPYVRVDRALHLSLDWSATTQVSRLGADEDGIALSLPLLAGEHVTTPGLKVDANGVTVAMGQGESGTQWDSKLDKAETLTLTAPALDKHAEVWSVQVSPTWHIEFSGVPAVAQAPDDASPVRRFEFHPLPGEQLVMRVTRPEAAQGATRAIDAVRLVRRLGQRSAETTLDLSIRASQGGEHSITLPPGAELLGSTRDQQALNLRLQERKLSLPLIPGSHVFQIRWRDSEPVGFAAGTPALALGLPAANIDLGVDLPADRWLLATSGPTAGPAVLYWSELAIALLLAFALGRLRNSPLKTWQWLLLAFGFSTYSWFALLVVVAWVFALDWRARNAPRSLVPFNLMQTGLPLLTLIALMCLLAAVQHGLLGTPDMAIAGNASDGSDNPLVLRWFADRSADALPLAYAYSLPLWLHKAAMLAWALWLASALIGWLRRGFAAWMQGGYWRKREKPLVDVPHIDPPRVDPPGVQP